MTPRLLLSLILTLLASVPSLARTAQADKVDEYIQAEMQKRHIPTTAADFAKWNLALDEAKVLKRATLDQMWSSAKLADGKVFRFGGTAGYAHGWVVDDRPGHKSVGHSGGGSTAYWRFLDDKLNVVVLTNLQGSDPDSIAQGVAALYVPEIAPETEENGGQ